MYAKLALFIFAAWAGAEVSRQRISHAPGPPKCCSAPRRARRGGRPSIPCTLQLNNPVRPPHPQGNGVIVGLGICGVVLAATSSAATLMGDFRTGCGTCLHARCAPVPAFVLPLCPSPLCNVPA